MQYAVIRSGGKQYKVSEGSTINVDKLRDLEKKSIVFDEVLLVVDEGNVLVGKPLVSGAKVEASLIGDVKGDKIKVRKFKAKSRYRKAIGFRAQMTSIKIEKIKIGSEKTVEKAKEPTKTTKNSDKK